MRTNELLEQAAYQLSIDYACDYKDFFGYKNKAVLSKKMPNRREFKQETDFFKAATFGGAAVASVSAETLAFAKQLLAEFDFKETAELFNAMGLFRINNELSKWSKTIAENKIYFLPKTPYVNQPKGGFNIKIYNELDIKNNLYKYKGFSNALLYQPQKEISTSLFKTGRTDKLAVCCFNGNHIAGMAGASNDSERFWQIGVDVKPEYREKGLALELVTILTKEIFLNGAIPYYGTWAGNVASMKVALKCGYEPAWTEIVSN